jgi:hypothetical protein
MARLYVMEGVSRVAYCLPHEPRRKKEEEDTVVP